jgi:hypothetical protein
MKWRHLLHVAAASVVVLAGALASTTPAEAHAGSADGTRPFVTGVEPATNGLAASVIFAGDWQVNLLTVGGDEISVLDDTGRPFLRFGSAGVEGDFGAPAWYVSAVVSDAAGAVKLPEGISPSSPPDWRPVSRARAWAWYDRRLKGEPGAVTPRMMKDGVPVRLREFAIPLVVGGRPAAIKGTIDFEPPRGRYVHRLTSAPQPAPAITVDLLGGRAVPTLTVRNDSAETVTVLGADGEPFLRIAATVDANLASPTWAQVARTLGRTPKTVADATAPPQWERISEGRLASWSDYRSRPPDTEPQIDSGQPIDVKRWTIPLRIGEREVAITGVTSFEPIRPPGHGSDEDRSNRMAVAAGIGGLLLLAGSAVGWLRRRGSRSLR